MSRYISSADRRKKAGIFFRMGIVIAGGLAVLAAIVLLIRGGIRLYREYRRPALTDWAYADTAYDWAEEYDVPIEIVYAVVETESHFDEAAVSPVGACGLMQLMPETYGWIKDTLRDNEKESDERIFDPEVNIRYGTYYLSYLYERFENWETAYAGYNAGPTIVSKWLKDPNYSADGETLHTIPYGETADYVVKVAAARERYEKEFADS